MVPHSFKHAYSSLGQHVCFQLNPLHASYLYNFLERKRARTPPALAIELEIPLLPALLRQFLFEQLHPDDPQDLCDIPEFKFPTYEGQMSNFNSASSGFYAPNK
ncbi:hypothetical protein P692DRAFT_20750758 [Suillus brevipes Sb2]|nr:hypothetical protein P692DRAFT_20750758 [Suillus brevipes Sb2]